jgi:hypothetical protein
MSGRSLSLTKKTGTIERLKFRTKNNEQIIFLLEIPDIHYTTAINGHKIKERRQ